MSWFDIEEVPLNNLMNPQTFRANTVQEWEKAGWHKNHFKGPDFYIILAYEGPCPRGCCRQEYSSVFTSAEYTEYLEEIINDAKQQAEWIKAVAAEGKA